MPVTGTCPSCGQKAPIEHFVIEEKYKKALLAAFKMPAGIADLVLPYLGLFAPASGRAIRADKLARIVTELTDLVGSAQVTRSRITHVAPLELWRAGIEQTLLARDTGSLALPLESHAYLSEIVWRLAAKAQARGETAQPAVSHPSHRPFDARPEQAQQLQAEIGGLKRLIGGAKGEAKTQLEGQLTALEKRLEKAREPV